MAPHLRNQGYCVGRKRVQRLMAKMGLRAVFQRSRTTVPHPEHRKYPDLLRNMVTDRPNRAVLSGKPLRVCRRFQLPSRMEHHEQGHEQGFA
jgi:transposase InsO family protein